MHSYFARIPTVTKFDCCTLYDRKNQTNTYDFLRIKRVHALLLFVSFKPTFDDFTLVIDMYHHHHRRRRRHGRNYKKCTFVSLP